MKKNIIFFAICLFLCVNLSFASGKINKNNSLDLISGPFFDFSSTPMPMSTASFASMSQINDEVFSHDGINYIKGEMLGNFMLTGYCACKKCTYGTGITYSGKPVRANHTVAADLNVLPLGTFIILEGTTGTNVNSYDGVYQVEDKGGGVKNKHIDIYLPTHELASLVTHYGRAYANVYLAVPLNHLYIN